MGRGSSLVRIIQIQNDQDLKVSPGNKDKKGGAFLYIQMHKNLGPYEIWHIKGLSRFNAYSIPTFKDFAIEANVQ